jgi:phosphorylcholine metabolism protein LicD
MNEMKEINTSKGVYKYKELIFVNGTKKINREIAKKNLLALKKCFDSNNLSFGLIYGTLLGAVREKNFIEHDEDTDIFILYENQSLLFDLLFDLREIGFEVGRLTPALLSIIKDGEYIDIYFYKIKNNKVRECDGYEIESKVLEELENYPFLNEIFKVPKNPEKVLETLYGKNWKIPDINAKASNYGLYLRIKFLIKNNSKILFNIMSFIKRKLGL